MKKDRDIIIHPEQGRREKDIPPCGIILVNPLDAKLAVRLVLDGGGERRFLFHSELAVSRNNDFFVAGPAVGAPMAAITLEKLIVLGARKVLQYGWCGSLSPNLVIGDIILGGAAHSGEGTSRYYIEGVLCRPSVDFTKLIMSSYNLADQKAIWSTDALFRESRKKLFVLRKEQDVSAVDMEYSALCAVSAFRNIDFAAIFKVSDELWHDEWRPGFAGKDFKAANKEFVEILITSPFSTFL